MGAMSSKTFGLWVAAITLALGAAAFFLDHYSTRFLYNFLFYGLAGTYQVCLEEYGLTAAWTAGLDELVLSPLIYGGAAYLVDRYLLIRFFKTPLARFMLIMLLFFLLTIPVIQWYPPGSENFI